MFVVYCFVYIFTIHKQPNIVDLLQFKAYI